MNPKRKIRHAVYQAAYVHIGLVPREVTVTFPADTMKDDWPSFVVWLGVPLIHKQTEDVHSFFATIRLIQPPGLPLFVNTPYNHIRIETDESNDAQ